jgi:uncharacterized membrane protein YdjX (TVP38/TMEM64 family)
MVGANRIHNLDAVIIRDGCRLVCLLRASPLMPFIAVSYLLGCPRSACATTGFGTLAALPALLGYVSLGAFARPGLSASAGATPPFQPALLAGVHGEGPGGCAYRDARRQDCEGRTSAAGLKKAR